MNMRLMQGITAGVFTLALACGAGAASAVFDYDPAFYPYYPSLIKWNSSKVPFTPPSVCAGCHEKQFREWTGSVHSLAFKDPIYQGELNKAVKAVGHGISRQCEGCHSAAGMVTGEVKGPGLKGLSEMALAGVSCDICHSVSGVTHWQTPSHEPENGSMILTPGIDTPEGPVPVKRGPKPAIKGCGGGFHQCEESTLHLRADLCASCHQVYHHEAHFPLEATYLEWKHGPYAQQEILCQDCHMVPTPIFRQSADEFRKPLRKEYTHSFTGANYLLYHLASAAAGKAGNGELAANLREKYQAAIDRLQSAAALELQPVYQGSVLREMRVRVKNIRAGHNLPTSLTNVRQMWLEVTVTDPAGKVLYTSGVVTPEGALPENTRLFNSDGMGKDFHFAVDPWVVTAFSRHDTIPPRGYKEVYYALTLPAGVPSVTFEAKLRYRQADQAVAEALLGAVPKDIDLKEIYGLDRVPPLPVVDMVTARRTVTAAP